MTENIKNILKNLERIKTNSDVLVKGAEYINDEDAIYINKIEKFLEFLSNKIVETQKKNGDKIITDDSIDDMINKIDNEEVRKILRG